MQSFRLAAVAAAGLALAATGLPRPGQEPTEGQVPTTPRVPTVTEAETGLAFPVWLDLEVGEESVRHHMLGTGVREKTIFKVDVYGMAMYVDRTALGAKLRDLAKSIPSKKAGTDTRLADSLLEGRYGVSMRWVMARDVEDEDVREAFDDWLGPRLDAAVAATLEEERADARRHADTVMTQFRGLFSADLQEGEELCFAWLPGGRLHSWIRGKANPVVESEMLCRALWDCYVGRKAAEPKARRAFLAGLWRLARAWEAPMADKETSDE
jgi:hypothetical protein